MTTPKLLASDYDKTFFYKTNPEVLPSNLRAVETWREAGNLFAITTGRDAASMLFERKVRDVEFDYLVALNGSLIIDKDDNVLFKQAIDQQLARAIVDDIRDEFDDELIISNGFDGCNFTNRKNSESDPIAKEVFERNQSIYTRSIEQSLEHEVLLLGCLAKGYTHAKAVRERILSRYESEVEVFINLNYINVVPKGISKASGIARVMAHAGVEHAQVSVIGDDHNDIPMLEAYTGFAVPNAKPEVIEAATRTVTDVAGLIGDLI